MTIYGIVSALAVAFAYLAGYGAALSRLARVLHMPVRVLVAVVHDRRGKTVVRVSERRDGGEWQERFRSPGWRDENG